MQSSTITITSTITIMNRLIVIAAFFFVSFSFSSKFSLISFSFFQFATNQVQGRAFNRFKRNDESILSKLIHIWGWERDCAPLDHDIKSDPKFIISCSQVRKFESWKRVEE